METLTRLTPEPLEMKPHVYCTWRVGGGSKSDFWNHLSTNWRFILVCAVSFSFYFNIVFPTYQGSVVAVVLSFFLSFWFSFFSKGGEGLIGPKAI